MTYPQPSPAASPQGYGYPPGYGYGPAPTPSNGAAVAALVLGCISLPFGILPFIGWFATPFAIAAVGFGFAGLSRGKKVGRGRGLAAGGLATGAVALIAITAWTAIFVIDAKNKHDLFTGADRYWGCDAIQGDLEDAVDDYRSLEGVEPTSESDLIGKGYWTWNSPDWDIEVVDGRAEVVPQPGGDC